MNETRSVWNETRRSPFSEHRLGPTRRERYGVLGLACAVVLLWQPFHAPAQSTNGNGCASTTLFSSGMQAGKPLPPGIPDANYTPASPNFPPGAPVVIGAVPPTWVAGDPAGGPQWIGPSITSLVQPPAIFIYRLKFVAPCPQTIALCKFAAADNASVVLNGAPINVATPSVGYVDWTTFRLTDLPVGTNTLDFLVQGGSPIGTPPSETGLLAELALTSDCCECIVLDCPTNVVVETCGPGATVSLPIRALSLCGSNVQVALNPPLGTIFPIGTTMVTATAFDSQQNSNTCTFPVTVKLDQTPPTLVMPSPMVVPCTSAAGAIVNYSVSAIDNCTNNFTLLVSPQSGSQFPIGTTLVTCVATDGAGNQTNGTFSVKVLGDCAADCIQLECPPGITVDAIPQPDFPERASGALVNFQPAAANSCGGPIYLSSSPPSGSFFPIGTNQVTCVASDNAGQSKTCLVQIVVRDVTPPQFPVPDSYVVECTSLDGGATVSFPFAATDNSGVAPTLIYDPPSGSHFAPGATLVTGTALDAAGNRTVRQFTLQVQPGPKCMYDPAQDPQTAPDNWSFELGLTAWVPTGNAFTAGPAVGNELTVMQSDDIRTNLQANIGGDFWSGTSLAVGNRGRAWIHSGSSGAPGGDALMGTLRSKTFIVPQRFLTFLIGGGQDDTNLRVEFLIAVPPGVPGDLNVNGQNYQIVLHKTGHGAEFLRRDWWDIGNYVGQRAVLRIVDSSSAGHISVDDFQFQDASPVDTKVSLGKNQYASVSQFNNGIYIDWNAPLWGFADMHTHPMSYLGFGGKVMHGQPDGVLADALNDCNCDHGGWGLDNTCGDYLRQVFMGVMDDKGNSPHREGYSSEAFKEFRNWPVFTTISHQQMWYEWMRRARDGGLRVMVALCVNNPLLAAVSKGPLPARDLDVGNSQISELKSFVARHTDFMDIAYDPVQLRNIVRSGRLAVIIGSELDDIGNFCTDPNVNQNNPDDYSRQVVRNEIQRLYGLGVRYMFTVHLVNNKFGGTPIGSMMLNVANKYLNQVPFSVLQAPSTNKNTVWLAEHFDYTAEAIALGIGTTLLPVLLPGIIVVADTLLTTQGIAPPGSGIAIGAALMPVMLIGAAVAPFVFAAIIGTSGIPLSILPVANNYPPYQQKNVWANGTINQLGLTKLGQYAVNQMMAQGMMLDVDHMSLNTIEPALTIAENVPGIYPMNSGHNSFQELAIEWSENSRTTNVLERIRKSGGLMGVGWENTQIKEFSSVVPKPQYSSSRVLNDCGGTSKSFAQLYLYALEKMHRHGVAFGTDINGLIVAPGPRFGPQSAFGLLDDKANPSFTNRSVQVLSQIAIPPGLALGRPATGVLYTPRHGRPLTDAAFVGKAVDPDHDTDQPADTTKGYAYNQDQRDFFAAIKIFFSGPTASEDVLKAIENGLSDNYPNKRRVKEYAFGLVKGITGADPGNDITSPDTGTREQLGKAVCRFKIFNEAPPQEIQNDANKFFRFKQHCTVWDHYQSIFGPNAPLKRCVTDNKDWDINFEGMAHYGLLPDFIQDLINVGLQPKDVDVLFQSAEHFAQMWERCQVAAGSFNPLISIIALHAPLNGIKITWQGMSSDVLQESFDLNNPLGWHRFAGDVSSTNGTYSATIPIASGPRYYRVQQFLFE